MGHSGTKSLSVGTTPSHGNPQSTSALNTELNNVARNTNDTQKARALVAAGADLSSTNGPAWRHTPLHQASYHGRYEMAKVLVELGSALDLHSNPCGRGATGTPLELARGGGHHEIAAMLEKAAGKAAAKAPGGMAASPTEGKGEWRQYTNIDMCFQGDAEIIHDWKSSHTIESLKKIVEQKGYSAVCVGSFGHAALKNFEYQLTAEDCKPSQGYTNELYIWFPDEAKPPKPPEAPRPDLPVGFSFQSGYGEATRADQVGHIPAIEGFCFGGDKLNWPLQWAAMIGDVAAIETLVAAGHDPNVKMGIWFDSEPLGWAASFGQCKAIEALCALGADPRRPANLSGNTPLSDAEREGHSKAIELIKEYLSGSRPVGESMPAVAQSVALGTPVVGVESLRTPPLHEIVMHLRDELGLLPDLSMAEVVDRAMAELGLNVGKEEHDGGAALLQKAEAAWKTLHMAH